MSALMGVVVWGSVGCAQERDPINRVQANALDKSFFIGANLADPSDDPEFYMRNTIVDVPYGAGQDGLFTATYAQPLNRIKWEIQENMLIGRQTYERIQNSDFNGSKLTNTGQVVAMFVIEGQFDIRRSYNPQTGEELNIVEENSTDRPWYQRQYMRVDWSKNLVTDGYEVDTLSSLGVIGGVQWDPMSYYVSDPNSPDAPVIATDQGYFDVTTKAFATPQIVNTPFGNYPACFLPGEYGGTYPYGNCNATEVTLRLSFKKVVDTDYEATDWDGTRMDAFGWFTQDRYGYDRNYGILDENWHRFASKYNIWDKSHVEGSQCAVDYWRDANGNIGKYKADSTGNQSDGFARDANGLPIPDPNGQPFPGNQPGDNVHAKGGDGYTEANCSFAMTNADGTPVLDGNGNATLSHPGSRCDEFARKCTLPLNERKLKSIPWYFGLNAAPDLYPSTNFALNSWSVAVTRAALLGQIADGNRVGADVSKVGVPMPDGSYSTAEADLRNDFATMAHTQTPVFILCHNPVIDQDDPVCGKPGLTARLGDIRYNSINIIANPQTPSPWGIMVDADDPLTGEKVSTSVNEWGAVLDIASQGTEDLLRWINGEISDQQIASGAYLRDWVNASKLGTAGNQSKTLSTQEIKNRLGSINSDMAQLNGLTAADAKLPARITQLQAAKNLQTNLGPSLDSTFESRRQALVGTPYETMLVTPDNLQMAGMDPATPAAGDDMVTSKASLLRGQNIGLQKWLTHQKEVTMAKRASCQIEQPEPDALVGMARQAARLYPLPAQSDANYAADKEKRDQALHQWIREQFHISVIAHEMGHSMGLRHNFTGSVDSLNYHQEYWKLRTRNGQEHYCTNGTFSNAAPLDALTPHTNGADCVGPRWVDPVTDDEVNNLVWKWGSSTVMDYPGDQTQDMNDIGSYDKAAMRFGYGDLVDVDNDAIFDPSYSNASGGRAATKGDGWIQALDGFGGIGGQTIGGYHYSQYNDKFNILGTCTGGSASDPLSSTCTGYNLAYVPFRDMLTVPKFGPQYLQVRSDLVSNFAVVGTDDKKKQRVRHPYMFGSDEFADFGNVPVFRFDAGADPWEQIQFLITTYENRYIFDNFRRDRVTFNTATAVHRAQDRYFGKLQGIVKSFALLLGESANPQQDASNPGTLMPLSMGSSDVLAMFARVITRPEPGAYQVTTAGPGPNATVVPNTAALESFGNLINRPQGDFMIALGSGEGRYIHNDYDYTKGYWWSEYQTQVGTFAEKEHAVYYLMEAYNSFLSNSEQDYIDGRYKNLNFYSLYPNQVRRLLAQMMQLDPTRLGPYVNGNNGTAGPGVVHVQYPAWELYDSTAPALNYPDNSVVLAPLVGWEQQYPGLINAWLFGSTMLTNDWASQIRVWTPSGVDAIDVLPQNQIRFRDPRSGTIYAARTFGQEEVGNYVSTPAAQRRKSEKTVGARMIEYANELAAQAYTATGPALVDPDGVHTYPNYDVTTPKDILVVGTLNGYVSNLDVARGLAKYLGTFENPKQQ